MLYYDFLAVLLSSYASLFILFLNFCSYVKKKFFPLPPDSKICDSRTFSFCSLLYCQCFHAGTQRCPVNTHWVESGCIDVHMCLRPYKAIAADLLKMKSCSLVDFLLKINTHCLKTAADKDRNIHQWNRIESPETNPRTYGHLIFDKGGRDIQWKKDYLFNKLVLGKLVNHL